ncbi:MAG TPA: hypothetical protein VH328_04590, partial [Burkholderiaceae bacterium]|nr:hypothetical protein [Burkholderiaceae bacterium]
VDGRSSPGAGAQDASSFLPLRRVAVGEDTWAPRAKTYADALENSRDYRQLLDTVIRQGLPGRFLYGQVILSTCRNLREDYADLPGQPAESNRQQQARDLMVARCASFSDDEVALDTSSEFAKDPRVADDPYKRWLREWESHAFEADARKRLLIAAFDTSDPLLLDNMDTLFARPGSDSKFFDGQEYARSDAVQALGLAWKAAACEGTGTSCGQDDPWVMEACAARNECHADRFELFEAIVRERSGADGANLYDQLYEKFVDAIQRHDTSVFMQ